MFCPKCGAEYRAGFDHCPDCDCPLVDAPPAKPQDAPGNFQPVRLCNVGDAESFAKVSALLTQAGVPFYAQDVDSGGYLRIVLGDSVFGQDIYVNQTDAAYAARLLTQLDAPVDEAELARLAEQAPAEDVPENSSWRLLPKFALILLGLLILLWLTSRIL